LTTFETVDMATVVMWVIVNPSCRVCLDFPQNMYIAHLPALIQHEASSTGACIGSRKVGAVLITSTIVQETFIDICKSKVLVHIMEHKGVE